MEKINDNPSFRIFLSAGEASSDLHCAHLIEAIKARNPGIECVGLGGPKMEAAGCRLLGNTVDHAVMLLNVAREIPFFYGLLRDSRRYFREQRVDLVIVCDSWAFNKHVAKAAKKQGIRTLFYVAPQLWAWAPWRIKTLRRICDCLACILPFEPAWFGARGVKTTFVSNPLLDHVTSDLSGHIKTYQDYDPRRLKLALIPGSRRAEIQHLWRPMQQIALRLQESYGHSEFVAVAQNEQRLQLLESLQLPGFACHYRIDAVRQTALEVDFALVASGSATLEVATSGCPMAVMYQSNRLLWHLAGQWLVRPKFFSLANLIADEALVPEFMPYFTSIDPIVSRVKALTSDPEELRQISRTLIQAAQPLAQQKTSEAVAELALEMLTQR